MVNDDLESFIMIHIDMMNDVNGLNGLYNSWVSNG